MKEITSKNTKRHKNFFVDTSSLMQNSLTIFSLASCPVPKEILTEEKTRFNNLVEELGAEIKLGEPNDVYISSMVEWELNNIKDDDRRDSMSRLAARNAISVITKLKEFGSKHSQSMHKGIELPNGSKIYSIEHNEEEFLNKNKKLYQPNRDDRILDDYVNHTIKHLIEKNKNTNKSKPLAPLIEIITEDHNLRGKVYDEFGKLELKVTCNPLLSEMTESPNPEKKYTGIHKQKIIVKNDDYIKILSSNDIIFSDEDMVHLVRNGGSIDWENLTKMYPNQFLVVEPEHKELLEGNIPGYHYLRKIPSGFSTLNYYNMFMKKEYENIADPEIINIDANSITKKYLLRQIIDDSNISKNLKERLKKGLKKEPQKDADFATSQSIIEQVKDYIPKERLEQLAIRDKTAILKGAKMSLYSRQLNPMILPAEEQKAYVDLLMDTSIGLVTFIGPQGAGKTYFALAAGYSLVKQEKFERIVYLKPLTTTGEGIGYLPGSEEKKTAPVMQSCYDSLEKVLALNGDNAFYNAHPQLRLPEEFNMIDELKKNKILETEIITYISGRTIDNAFIIFDEAQLLNREQMKLMIGRIGEKSKLVLTGDFAQLAAADIEIRKKYDLLNSRSAGLSHVVEALNGTKVKCPYRGIYGHLSINREFTKRSQVAAISGYI